MLETISRLLALSDFVAFERLCCDLLAGYGGFAGIIPQGVGRIDGGKDAVLILRDVHSVTAARKKIIFHFSLRRDFRNKLEEDLSTVRRYGHAPDAIVFVTNQRCTPAIQDELKAHTKAKYGWELTLFDQEWLRIPLDGEYQRLRKDYLNIDYEQRVFAPLDTVLQKANRHPNRLDFENSAYYDDHTSISKIRRKLDTKRVCLVTGRPGSGKTSLARAAGYQLQIENCKHIVFYVSARVQPAYEKLLEHIHSIDHDFVTFIVDDCHAAIDEINELVARLHDIKRCRILFVSRSIDPASSGPGEESFLDALSGERIDLEPTEAAIESVLLAVLKRDDIAPRDPGSIERILERCQGDLHLLEFLVSAWIREGQLRPLAEIADEEILEDVYRRYLARSAHPEHVCAIAALSEYEIPIESRWLRDRAIIADLCEDAFVESIVVAPRGRPVEMLQFFHSTPARLVVRAALKRGIIAADSEADFLNKTLNDYVAMSPANFFDLPYQLYRNEGTALQGTLLSSPLALAEATRQISTFHTALPDRFWGSFFRFIFSVWRQEDSAAPSVADHLLRECFEKRFSVDERRQIYSLWQPPTIAWYVTLEQINSALLREYFQDLQFASLARRQDMTVSFIRMILYRAHRAGVTAQRLQELCAALDFEAIGQRSRNIGMSAIRDFLQRCLQFGATKKNLRAFCRALDFKSLGEQSRKSGLANVRRFIELSIKAGAERSAINEFCVGLDCYSLGRRSDGVGFPTIRNFVNYMRSAGVGESVLSDFCRGLNFLELGKALRQSDRMAGALFDFSFIESQAGITESMARDFIAGLGWDYLRQGIESFFSPDVLGCVRLLLFGKCRYTEAYLREQKIDFGSEAFWPIAFMRRPCGSMNPGQERLQAGLLKDALDRLKLGDRHLWQSSRDIDLRSWNILIHNLLLADKEYLERNLAPAFAMLSPFDFERLLAEADLYNINLFCSWFRNERFCPTVRALIPIEFVPSLCNEGKLIGAALEHISYLLFNLRFVGRHQWGPELVKCIESQHQRLVPKLRAGDLRTIDFFVWNMWIALETAEAVEFVGRTDIMSEITSVAIKNQVDQENLLGIIGTLFLSSGEVQRDLLSLFQVAVATDSVEKSIQTASTRTIRMLAGLRAVGYAPDATRRARYIDALSKVTPHADVKNEAVAHKAVLEWLCRLG